MHLLQVPLKMVLTLLKEQSFSILQSFIANITLLVEPNTYAEVAKDLRWREVMASEIQTLEAIATWSLTALPSGKTPISFHWVYKIKHKSYGTIKRYKARLVAKGYTQLEGVDYQETFSLTTKLVTFRCLLALTTTSCWSLH